MTGSCTNINTVIARGSHTDQAQIRQLGENFSRQRSLVDDKHFGILSLIHDLLRQRTVVDNQFIRA